MAVTDPAMHLSASRKVLSAIHRHYLCQRHDRLIVGVSGGTDSVTLLDLLTSLPDFPLTLIVAHLNHQLRGKESDADEQFVQELAAQYRLPFELRRTDIRQLARQQHRTLEEAGRQARYLFFEELRKKYNATATAVGHHADDQAETFLLRLLRGAGTTGLAAMSPINQAGVIRPLLELTRKELQEYLVARQLAFREDSSNSDHCYLRNRIRHELLPLLQDYNPAISQRLSATASLLGEDETLLADYTDAPFREYSRCGPGWTALPLQFLRQQRRPLRLRLYRKSFASILDDLQRFERRHYLLLDKLVLEGMTGARYNLPRNSAVTLTAEYLLVAQKELLQIPAPCRCTIDGPGMYELGNGLSLSIVQSPVPAVWKNIPPSTSFVAADRAPFPWLVRPVDPGERMELLGMKGSRTVQNILTDLKFPRHLRKILPLITCGDVPLWLAGIRRTRHALVRAEEKQAIQITLSGWEKLPLFP